MCLDQLLESRWHWWHKLVDDIGSWSWWLTLVVDLVGWPQQLILESDLGGWPLGLTLLADLLADLDGCHQWLVMVDSGHMNTLPWSLGEEDDIDMLTWTWQSKYLNMNTRVWWWEHRHMGIWAIGIWAQPQSHYNESRNMRTWTQQHCHNNLDMFRWAWLHAHLAMSLIVQAQ